MANIQGSGGYSEAAYDYVWTGFAASGDNGNGITIERNVANLTFGVFGNFGTSGAIQLQGSMDNTNWVQLKDVNGNAISMTAAGIVALPGTPRYIRAAATAGSGASLSAYIHGTLFN